MTRIRDRQFDQWKFFGMKDHALSYNILNFRGSGGGGIVDAVVI